MVERQWLVRGQRTCRPVGRRAASYLSVRVCRRRAGTARRARC